MKHWYNLTFNNILFCALLLLLVLNFFSTFIADDLLMNSSVALFIPVFLIFFFLKNNHIGFSFVSFLIFSFLGDTSYYFCSEDTVLETSSILYILSYVQLIIIVLPRFKIFKIDKIIAVYLIVVLSINLYFLYTIYEILKLIIQDHNEVLLIVIKSLALILLALIAFTVYLNTQTRQSILFLVATICFTFSSLINDINYYYLYDWSFIMLNRAAYVLGIYLLFKYFNIENNIRNPKKLGVGERFTSENILA